MALDGVTAGLPSPLSRLKVGFYFVRMQAFKRNRGTDATAMGSTGGIDKTKSAVNAMAASRKQGKTFAGFIRTFRLGQHPQTARNDSIRGKHPASAMPGGNQHRLFPSQPFRKPVGAFAALSRFIDIRCIDFMGDNTDLFQKIQPPGRSGCED